MVLTQVPLAAWGDGESGAHAITKREAAVMNDRSIIQLVGAEGDIGIDSGRAGSGVYGREGSESQPLGGVEGLRWMGAELGAGRPPPGGRL